MFGKSWDGKNGDKGLSDGSTHQDRMELLLLTIATGIGILLNGGTPDPMARELYKTVVDTLNEEIERNMVGNRG